LVDPDLFSPFRRDANGRFAKGHSGNPRGRPRGIRNPKRRIVDMVEQRVSTAALADLVRRKPYLLRRLAARVLPPARTWRRATLVDGWGKPSLDPAPPRRRGPT
jgi:hypothetical protein